MNLKTANDHGFRLISTEPRRGDSSNPREVLQEIFDLLEEFSPMWYTEEMHSRAVAALKKN